MKGKIPTTISTMLLKLGAPFLYSLVQKAKTYLEALFIRTWYGFVIFRLHLSPNQLGDMQEKEMGIHSLFGSTLESSLFLLSACCCLFLESSDYCPVSVQMLYCTHGKDTVQHAPSVFPGTRPLTEPLESVCSFLSLNLGSCPTLFLKVFLAPHPLDSIYPVLRSFYIDLWNTDTFLNFFLSFPFVRRNSTGLSSSSFSLPSLLVIPCIRIFFLIVYFSVPRFAFKYLLCRFQPHFPCLIEMMDDSV